MSTTCITTSVDFAFRLIDGSGECIATTIITGPRELGLPWAEHQLRELGLFNFLERANMRCEIFTTPLFGNVDSCQEINNAIFKIRGFIFA